MSKSFGFTVAALLCGLSRPASAFQLPGANISAARTLTTMASSTAAPSTSENISKSHLYVPSERDDRYQGNIAQYLIDLHDDGATFDFCGGTLLCGSSFYVILTVMWTVSSHIFSFSYSCRYDVSVGVVGQIKVASRNSRCAIDR